jgi:hypothetical protein
MVPPSEGDLRALFRRAAELIVAGAGVEACRAENPSG